MTKIVLCLVLICLFSSAVYGGEVNSPCEEGWIPYEDEKCVRLIQTFANHEVAEGYCQFHDSTLVSVTSESKQQLLTQLVQNATDGVNVWIGAQRLNGGSEFVWNDGTTVQRFTNWATAHPTDTVGRNCVQLRSPLSRHLHFGMEWVDISCAIQNWFICQKPQVGMDLHQAILDLRREVKNLQENPIPIGFIYVQLPDQPEPSELWPTVRWSDITDEYAGLFFRAEGGLSEKFESIQEENSPRLTSVLGRLSLNAPVSSIAVSANGMASETVSAGASGAVNHWGLSFAVSQGEVRPRNAAIRIWRRFS